MSAHKDHEDGAAVGEQHGHSRLEAFMAIAENTPDSILRFDRQLRYVYVNPAAERRLRRQRHAIRGKTQRELGLAGDVAELWDEQLERVFRSGRERQFEFALGANWVDAREHFEARVVPEIGARGEVETVLVVVRDVTERRLAEEAREKRAAELANAQRIAGCGSFQWEDATDELRCSEELLRLLPLPSPESGTASLGDLLALVHDDDRERVRRTLDDASGSARGWSMQFRVLDKDGVERVLHSRGEAVTDDGGKIVGLRGTALDVTEQEDVQSTVRKLLRFSRFATENASDAILWVDPMGRVVSANRAACDRFGRSAEGLADSPLGMLGLMPPEGWSERWQQLKSAGRLRYEVAHAGDVAVEITAHHASIEGEEYGCLFVREARAPRAALRLPAHARDLRTPLETILLWAELIERNDDPVTRARGLALIAESARAQQRLLDSLLGASPPARAEPTPHPTAQHLLGNDELEIRSVGQLSAIALR